MLTIQTDFWYIDQLRFSHASNNLIVTGRKRTGTDNRPLMVKEFDPRAASPDPEQWLQFPPTSLVALDPAGRHGAICKRQYRDDYIYFFQWRNRKPGLASQSISVASAELSAIALCADADKVATLVDERTERPASMSIDIWHTSDESLAQRLSIFPNAVQLIWSPDGRFVAHAADDGSRVELTRVTNPVTTRLASGDAYRLAFSPQGTFLASGGQFIRCWEVESGEFISRFRGQDEDVPDLAFARRTAARNRPERRPGRVLGLSSAPADSFVLVANRPVERDRVRSGRADLCRRGRKREHPDLGPRRPMRRRPCSC